MYHPWRRLRGLDDWLLEWDQLPEGISGEINWPTHTITIDPRLSQAQRRCTLAHELVHIDLGLVSDVTWAAEQRVRDVTARRLLPDIDAVASALADGVDIATASDELWVTEDILTDRLTTLADAERAMLNRIPA